MQAFIAQHSQSMVLNIYQLINMVCTSASKDATEKQLLGVSSHSEKEGLLRMLEAALRQTWVKSLCHL